MTTFSIRSENPINEGQLLHLKQSLGSGPVLITTHANPDPDALAAGKALNHLFSTRWGIPASLLYDGVVGRAENRAMLELVTPEWKHVDAREQSVRFSSIVFVDCQPGSRTTSQIDGNLPLVVIDHHYPISEQTQHAAYADVRSNVGSTVTMAYEYLDAARVDIDPILAAAMFYGLRADTNGLIRGATVDDGIVYVKLLERLDQGVLLNESAGWAQEYYEVLCQGIKNARIHGKAVIAYLGKMHRPDLVAELADVLFRYEQVHAALCSGIYGQELLFSIRTGWLDEDAGRLVQKVIFPPGSAGGHGVMAGGQIPVAGGNVKDLVVKLEGRFLETVGESVIARPLLREHDVD